MQARLYNILKHTKAEGPQTRYCIWFQGCLKHCKGCFARGTWDFEGGYNIDCDELLKDIFLQKDIEGVTFLGGEPFEQPEALEYLARNIKKKDLGIVCFTGKNYNEIKELHQKILNNIDLLIDGGFVEEKKDYSRPWTGSSNQNYYFLSDRYDKSIFEKYKNSFEINIKKDGSLFINGMGDIEALMKKINTVFFH